MADRDVALIVGAGQGLSAALARRCLKDGMRVALASRSGAKLADDLVKAGARDYRCDASKPDDVARLFDQVAAELGAPALVVYNASGRLRGPIAELDPAAVERALLVSCYGGFLVGQLAAKQHAGAGQRLDPVHRRLGEREGLCAVGAVRDGQVRAARAGAEHGARAGAEEHPCRAFRHRWRHRRPGHAGEDRGADGLLDPAAIAETYLHIHRQHRSAWTWEVELRPWVEKF